MKILIINPNSDLEMTKDIQKTADAFVDSDVEV
ncbi:MAG: Asp/Glu/hydantoin racemase, partial [Candidatus Heimdallarchaeota archaeon]|nr:Asp/Glu/hydantoin racemase [Candidatus Heimdallarchaeota archaeon]